MAKVGISKSYSAGAFTDASAIFASIKQMVIDAGFYIVENTATLIDFMPASRTPAADSVDDVPHWYILLSGTTSIKVASAKGAGYSTPGTLLGTEAAALTTSPNYWDGNLSQYVNSPIDIWAAADGIEGWFWICSKVTDFDAIAAATKTTFASMVVGSRTKRLAADTSEGLAARYGIADIKAGSFLMPYGLQNDGGVMNSPAHGLWSPLNCGGAASIRHPTSALAAMAMPVYPNCSEATAAAHVYGECLDVLITTDGFANLGQTIPGWRTLNVQMATAPYPAVRDPGTFTAV